MMLKYNDNAGKSQMESDSPEDKKRLKPCRKKTVIKILVTVILVIAAALGGFLFAMRNRGVKLDETAIAYQMPGGIKNTDPESIMLPGYDVLEMNSETQMVDIALFNPEGNDCYFRFHIVLKKDNKELYQTGLIKPGTAVTQFKIEEKLRKGEYPIIIKVDTVDLNDPDNAYNGGAIEAVLKVK
ncbi:hypothetical protein [uncultured Robinsoniella sp.]|uniref:hypothetical protein n=1 Tax=uncultured Robinsoniella sp. TaxID=904190 RepID=UPI00374ECAB9